MSTPILATKLYVPPPQSRVVLRPRLTERLVEGLHRRLTLISAPAGFGKTTLLSDWLAGCERPAAWLSLDEGDGDPTRFLAYLVAALQTIAPNIAEGVLGALQSPQPPPTESILTALLNEITTIPDQIVLVLDDYHAVDARAVDDALTFLLEHLPPRMHLIIATREDPQLPLARLRARGQLTELRATDLRFTPEEAAEFLKEVMGLSLSTKDIAALEDRTEGWIAGLQLAALSMRGREDVAGFIRAFAGDNRYVVDYLVEEVLQRQPERVRSFLLQTSILERLSGPLCDAVTVQEGSNALLEALERGNLFVVPLDDRRHWFRYHHLFANVLQARAMEEQPDQVPTLHRRASEWYDQNGLPSDAIRHALAAEDFERAAGLIERAWPAMDRSYQSATWLGWAKALPDELVRVRPVLSAGYARELLDVGELEAAEARLRDAERWLDTTADMNERPDERPEVLSAGMSVAGMVVVDEEQFRSLPASIATARAAHAQALGDMSGAVKYARRALDLLPEGYYYERGVLAAYLGVAYWVSGDLEAARRSFADFMANMRMAGNILVAISGTFVLADIKMAQGRLQEAIRTYEQSLQLATAQGEPVLQGTADLYVGLSELQCEQGDLEAARQHLLTSEELGEHAALPELQYRSCVAMARIKETQGDLDGALELLDEAERQYISSPVSDVRPVAALKARLWIGQGRLTEALDWAREQGLSAHDDLSYLREFEHVTLARVLIARYKSERVEHSIHEAMELLERLLQAAEEGGRMGSVIEILMLQALAHEAQGDSSTALVPLERALTLAEPEGYVRIFVDEGTPMARLLYEALSQGVESDYIRRLLAAFPVAESEQTTSSQLRGRESELVEPLSARELEVLQLIAEGLTNQEVATRLYLSLHTVKVHTRNIFTKLAVKNRTQAVARGKALGILSQT
jgi:LuxR family transcriptional regulator, maltose regulon positive regulatory protein